VSGRWRPIAVVLALGALSSACTSDATVGSPPAAPASAPGPAAGPTTEPTTEPATTVESAPVTDQNEQTGENEEDPLPSTVHTSGTQSRTTIATDAGTIDASYAGGRLDVEIASKPGWVADVQRRSPTRLEVVWTSDGAAVRAEVEAGDGGISSTTRSATTG